MAPAAQAQISFPCRKASVRRKIECDENQQQQCSPPKSPRTVDCEALCEPVSNIRLTRSSSRQTRVAEPTTPSSLCVVSDSKSRRTPKIARNIFKNETPSIVDSPLKAPTQLLASPRKTPRTPRKVTASLEKPVTPKKSPKKVDENTENQPVLPSVLEVIQQVSPKKIQLQQPNVSNFTKARQALHTSTPTTIVCRDKELEKIGEFLQPHIDERRPGSMYISGRPGTGKTACVTHILNNRKFTGKFKSIFINCMLLHTPASIYSQIAQQLDPKWAVNAKDALGFLEDKLTDSGPMIVLVLDEVDQMSTKDQTILYTLFELPALKDSRLILVGLANALDLTDRSLVRLQSRAYFKPVVLNFPPYTKQDIATILGQRIKEVVHDDVNNVIAPSALQYLGGKISSASGDLRKAIDVCRRAVELAETTTKKQLVLTATDTLNSAAKCVSIPLLCKLMSNVESNRFCAENGEDADETPIQQKLIIVTLLVLVKHGKSKQVTLGKLHQSYTKVCNKFGVTAMDFDEFLHTCSLVETRGIVTLKKKNNSRLTPICLRLDEREVESTLKDKTLLSSILTQGTQFL